MSWAMTDQIEQHRLAMQDEVLSDVREENSKWTPFVTREDAEADLVSDNVTRTEFARHELWDRERNDSVIRLETIMEQHLKDYVELKEDTGESLVIGRKVLANLEGAASVKKHGREWLMALSAVCVVILTVLGLVL